jgi:hypothetical protein
MSSAFQVQQWKIFATLNLRRKSTIQRGNPFAEGDDTTDTPEISCL